MGGNGKSGGSKYTVLGKESGIPGGQTVAAATNDDTNALVFMDYLHDQQHRERILKLNVLNTGVLINTVFAFAWKIGIYPSDMYLDAFSSSGKLAFRIERATTPVPDIIGANVLMRNMADGSSFVFTITGTKGPIVASNSVTQLTAEQYASITDQIVIHKEEIGDKKTPGTPTVKFPLKLAINTTYIFWYQALENLITINNNILFNQECGGSC